MDLYDYICGVLQLLGVVFLRVLNISIAAGVMILAVVLIRRLFPKMPTWLCCLLWALPALRLLPFSLPNPYSLAPNRETVYEVSTAVSDMGGVSVPVLNSGVEAVDNIVNPALERSFVAATQSAEAVTSKVRDFDPSAFFGMLWAVGCAVLLAYLLFSFLRFRKKVRPCVLYEKGVYLTDGVSAPFILGVLRPRIYLPSALPPEHYPAILAHERAHLKRKDHLWKPLGFLLLAVHWFNPLVWLGYRLLCRDIEFACDEKVIRDADAATKKAYSEALLTCGAPLKGTSACPLAFGEVGVKARIKRVLHYKKPAVWIAAVALLTAAVAAFCFLTDRPFQWKREWNSEFVTGRVYLDSVVSPQKASKQTPRTVILDEENHLVIRYADGASYDYGPADISGEYLWDYVKDYVPAQYRNSRPSKSPEAVSVDPYRGSGYASHTVIFRPRGNAFFLATVSQTPEGYAAESVCRLTRTGDYVREERSPRWYVAVPGENVRFIGVAGGDLGRGVTYAVRPTFEPGECVWLKCLEGRDSVDGLTFTLYDIYGQPLTGGTADGTVVLSEYGDGVAFSVNRLGQAPRNAPADPRAMAAEFLTLWFSPDHNGRYTDFSKKVADGPLSEEASDAYFSEIRDYVTDEYYDRIVMNRGYHSYDQMADEKRLTVTVRSVQLRQNEAGGYDFTVFLNEKSNGMGDTVAGTLRFQDGRIDGMHISDMTLGKERQGSGETPTSYFYEDGETTRYEGEWTTAVPPEGPTASGALSDFKRMATPFADWLEVQPEEEATAQRALQQLSLTQERDGISMTLHQALTYTTVICLYAEITLPEELAARYDTENVRLTYELTGESMSGSWSRYTKTKDAGTPEKINCFFWLSNHQNDFYPEQAVSLSVRTIIFGVAGDEKTVSFTTPMAFYWHVQAIEGTKIIPLHTQDGMNGEAQLTPVCLRIWELTDSAYASIEDVMKDCRLTDETGNTVATFGPFTGEGSDSSKESISGSAFVSFIDTERVKYLYLGNQKFLCDLEMRM